MQAEEISRKYKLWDEFLALFPIEKLESMTLEQYTGGEQSFVKKIDYYLYELFSSKPRGWDCYGIVHKDDLKRDQYRKDFGYVWVAYKYGDTYEKAFETIKAEVIKVAYAAQKGDLPTICESILNETYKWHLAYLYQNRYTPCIVVGQKMYLNGI